MTKLDEAREYIVEFALRYYRGELTSIESIIESTKDLKKAHCQSTYQIPEWEKHYNCDCEECEEHDYCGAINDVLGDVPYVYRCWWCATNFKTFKEMDKHDCKRNREEKKSQESKE